MADVPRDAGPARARRLQHRQKARPIVLARSVFNKMPADPVTCAGDPAFTQCSVVVFRELRMPRGTQKVETPSIPTAMTGALEAANKEAAEGRGELHLTATVRYSAAA